MLFIKCLFSLQMMKEFKKYCSEDECYDDVLDVGHEELSNGLT